MESSRPTLTRMAMGAVLPGSALIPGFALAKRQARDSRELYLVVEHPEWIETAQIQPDLEGTVKQIVAAFNQKVRAHASRAAESEAGAKVPEQRSPLDDLKKLGELRDAGVLDEKEFAEQKQRILDRLLKD